MEIYNFLFVNGVYIGHGHVNPAQPIAGAPRPY